MFRAETAELTKEEIPISVPLVQRLVPGDEVYLDNKLGYSPLSDIKDGWYKLTKIADGAACVPLLTIDVAGHEKHLSYQWFSKARLLQSMF